MHTFHKLLDSALEWIALMLVVASSAMKTRAALQLENVALRHQIGVLQRSAKKRLSLNNADRLFWVGLSRVWPEWRSTLKILKPETVIAWHRNAVRKFWTWKVRRGKPGRPAISAEIRALIRHEQRANFELHRSTANTRNIIGGQSSAKIGNAIQDGHVGLGKKRYWKVGERQRA